MDTDQIQSSAPAWLFFVKASFFFSIVASVAGIVLVPGDLLVKGYFALSLLFVVSSTITLSKTLRDEHEKRAGARMVDLVGEANLGRGPQLRLDQVPGLTSPLRRGADHQIGSVAPVAHVGADDGCGGQTPGGKGPLVVPEAGIVPAGFGMSQQEKRLQDFGFSRRESGKPGEYCGAVNGGANPSP